MPRQDERKNIPSDIPQDLLSALLDNPYECLVLVDADGIVRYMSAATDGIFPVSSVEAIGRHILEINPESKLPRVLETSKAEIGQGVKLKDRQRVLARFPLIRNGRIIGAFGKLLVKSPEKFKELYERIDTLEKHLDYYREAFQLACGARYSFDNIVGNSDLLTRAKRLAQEAAETSSSVMITGESGTGKELLAHAIHQHSSRRKNDFVKVNCSSLPNELIEAELFGYEGGSFTGAHKSGKPGKFELADKGTIFLDEIGDMPLLAQVKLMRVLQEKEIDRIGSSRPRSTDFRVICATNRDLEKMVRAGTFRLDLFYRINVITIDMPPLRQIKEDIPLIFQYFLEKLSRANRCRARAVSAEAMEFLKNYAWPGNVRELKNIAERAMIVCSGDRIEPKDLPLAVQTLPMSRSTVEKIPANLKDLLEQTERLAILDALKRAGNNKVDAARSLGIHRTGLYQKMKKYGIE